MAQDPKTPAINFNQALQPQTKPYPGTGSTSQRIDNRQAPLEQQAKPYPGSAQNKDNTQNKPYPNQTPASKPGQGNPAITQTQQTRTAAERSTPIANSREDADKALNQREADRNARARDYPGTQQHPPLDFVKEDGPKHYFYARRPDFGFLLENGKRVAFKGYYYDTSDQSVIDYMLANYSDQVTEVTQELFEAGTGRSLV